RVIYHRHHDEFLGSRVLYSLRAWCASKFYISVGFYTYIATLIHTGRTGTKHHYRIDPRIVCGPAACSYDAYPGIHCNLAISSPIEIENIEDEPAGHICPRLGTFLYARQISPP